jgi:site-specific DNA-methyltransferase (adenine-specific)
MIKLIQGDCLKEMYDIPDRSINAIICDLPYGTTTCKWDVVIPFDRLWIHYERIIKNNGVIILFGRNPFFARLICSNEKLFRYEIIWDKSTSTDFAQANNKPITIHENIAIFSKGKITYNRIDDDGFKPYSDRRKIRQSSELGAKGLINRIPFENKTTRTPTTIRKYFPDNRKGLNSSLHPTQKPLALMEWLVKTYTNENEIVLDNTMGSGTTGLACLKTSRQFIGIEKEKQYYDIAMQRISLHHPILF